MALNFKIAVFISLTWHAVCFSSVELTFGKKAVENNFELTKIFFLGQILQRTDYYTQSAEGAEYSAADRLKSRNLEGMLKPGPGGPRSSISDSAAIRKPSVLALANSKAAYFKPAPAADLNREESSIMFYPPMPYHFLLYFRDRQVAHMEVAFYVSPEGKIAGLKRKISTGNPEVDLLIMRNLSHFLNLNKSDFSISSWQTVKIDLTHDD
ncbi:MAG: hypothetical protein ABIH40_04250 [Candidatus Omnitrophota bacterium]